MKLITGALAVFLLVVSACGAPEQEIQAEETLPEGIIDLANTTCPVMGNPVMDGEFVDWEGYRIHFCCAGCDQTFLDNPVEYMKVLSEDPEVTEDLSSFFDMSCVNGSSSSGCRSGGDTEETECSDCTEEEMCETCSAEEQPTECHTG